MSQNGPINDENEFKRRKELLFQALLQHPKGQIDLACHSKFSLSFPLVKTAIEREMQIVRFVSFCLEKGIFLNLPSDIIRKVETEEHPEQVKSKLR